MSGHRLPSLGGLRAFESAARLGRMSLAARELCVTPGAVSRSIRHLEQELRVTLFSGPKSALCLTDRGRELAAVLTDAFGRTESTIGPYFHEVAGALQLSCPGTLAAHWLIPRLPRFQRHAPDIPVQLTTSNRPVDFQREPYDVAIRLPEHALSQTTRSSQLFPKSDLQCILKGFAKRMWQRMRALPHRWLIPALAMMIGENAYRTSGLPITVATGLFSSLMKTHSSLIALSPSTLAKCTSPSVIM